MYNIFSILAGDVDTSWKEPESALKNIREGKQTPNPFGFTNKNINIDGYNCSVTIRQSHYDGRPTLDIRGPLRQGNCYKKKEKVIKIRYGDKE